MTLAWTSFEASFFVSSRSMFSTARSLFAAEFAQAPADGLVGFRVEMAEGEVLELVAHLLDAHAAGERRVDVEGLLGDALALVGRHEAERAHVVQPVGELDQ